MMLSSLRHRGRASRFSACSSSCRSVLGLARLFGLYTIVEERQCKVYVLFGKVVGQSGRAGPAFSVAKLGLRALSSTSLGKCYVAGFAAGPGISPQPAGQFRGRRADGHRHLVRNVHQRSGGLSVQERRPARLAGRQRQQFHRPLPEQYEARRHAGKPPCHEPDRARRSVARNRRNGVTTSAPSISAKSISATPA